MKGQGNAYSGFSLKIKLNRRASTRVTNYRPTVLPCRPSGIQNNFFRLDFLQRFLIRIFVTSEVKKRFTKTVTILGDYTFISVTFPFIFVISAHFQFVRLEYSYFQRRKNFNVQQFTTYHLHKLGLLKSFAWLPLT